MNRPFLLISPILLLLAGCKPSGTTEVQGQVVDRHTGLPVPYAMVYVTGISSSPAGGGSSGTQGHPTDALGHFDFSFEARGQNDYTLFAYTDSGYASGYGDCPYLNNGRANKGVQVKAAAPAWVRVNCVDDPPSTKIWLSVNDPNFPPFWVGPGNYTFIRPATAYTSDILPCIITDSTGHDTWVRIPYTTTAFDTATVTIHF